jgi:membrane-bound lytic murein transglycosylase D
MPQYTTKALACAALLTLGASLAHANDISVFTYSPRHPLDPNDPLMQVLNMEEVDVWGRIRKGFGIPDLDNPLVTSQTAWYTARPDYIQRTTTRASRYLFHVVQELEKRNMPTELALLPFIESAFNPEAYSTAKAAGMWQFIPSTGRDFNLKQNMFRDERRDVLASTDAALTYLQKLYGMFGDWQLALAAYNWGEGSVQRAINKARAAGQPIDFNSLSAYMPLETKNYVPKLQAVKNIIANPEQYNIALPKIENQPYFVTIGNTRDIDIKVAAQLAELSMDEFRALNPQFNRPVITGGNTQILLPKSNAEKFKTNLGKWGHALSSWTSHKVTAVRERIETIAARFNTTPEVLREANHIPPKMVLKEGSTILVPRSEENHGDEITRDAADNAMMSMEPDTPPTRRITVKAGKGDTLQAIARRNRVTVADIKSWNILPRDTVSRGQVLVLNVPNNRVAAGPAVARNRAGRPVGHKLVHSKLAAAPVKSSKSAKPTKTANKSASKNVTRTANKSASKSLTKTLLARQ